MGWASAVVGRGSRILGSPAFFRGRVGVNVGVPGAGRDPAARFP